MAGFYEIIVDQEFVNTNSVVVTHNANSRYVTVRLIVDGESRQDLISETIPIPLNEKNAIKIKMTSIYSGRIQILRHDIGTVAPDLVSREQIQARAWDRFVDRWGVLQQDIVNGWMGVFANEADLFLETPTVTPSYAATRDSTYNTGAAEQSFRMYEWDGTQWIIGDYLDPKPSAPVPGGGSWIVDVSEPVASGNVNWSYWMGFMIRSKAVAVGKQIKAIAVQRGPSGGALLNYQILRSTSVQSSRPSTSTFTIVEENGSIQSISSAWAAIPLTSNITIGAENTWYMVWAWVGTGGTNVSISRARSDGVLIETDFEVSAGVYKSTTSGHPSSGYGASTSTTMYGICSAGAGDA